MPDLHSMTIGGADYDAELASITTGELTFEGNRERRSVPADGNGNCVNISLIADGIVETDESFFVELSTDDPHVILMPQNASCIIMDNDCKLA